MINAFYSKLKSLKAITGYSNEESSDDQDLITATSHGQYKKGIDTHNRKLYDVSGSAQTVLSVVSGRIITATGAFTTARKGDVVIFASGDNKDEEVVILKRLSANSAILSHYDEANPYDVSDTFRVYRAKSEVIDSNGNVQTTTAQLTGLYPAILDMSSSNVTSAAYTQVIADTGSTAGKAINCFYQGGTPIYIAIGGSGSEVNKLIMPSGGAPNETFPLSVPANSRISVKSAVSGESMTEGLLTFNVLG